MQNEMFTKHLSHTHTNANVPPLCSLPGFARRIGTQLSHIHLFYLWWQSCLINWILNKPMQKTSSHNFFYLSVHMRGGEKASARARLWRGYHFNALCSFLVAICVCVHRNIFWLHILCFSLHKCVVVSAFNSVRPLFGAYDCACALVTWQKYFVSSRVAFASINKMKN